MRRTSLFPALVSLLVVPVTLLGQQRPDEETQPIRIGLSSQQQKELDSFFSASHRQRQQMRGHLRDLYHELHHVYDGYEFDAKRAEVLRREIAALQQQLLDVYAENEVRLRKILNRDQFDRLRAELRAERERRHRERESRSSAPPQ